MFLVILKTISILQFTMSVRQCARKVLIFVLDLFILLNYILSLVTLLFSVSLSTSISVMALPCLFSSVSLIFYLFFLCLLCLWLAISVQKIPSLHDRILRYNFLRWKVSPLHLGACAPYTFSVMFWHYSFVSQFCVSFIIALQTTINKWNGATVGFFW